MLRRCIRGCLLLHQRSHPDCRALSPPSSLRGFATIALPIGLRIFDVPVLVGKNGAWANLPSKPQLDGDSRQKTDMNGKPAYTAIVEWRDRALSGRFSDAVVALIREAHPGDPGDGDAT